MAAPHQDGEERLRAGEAQLQRQSKAYEALAVLGRERLQLHALLDSNIDDTLDLVREARADLEMHKAAAAAATSRATLYRWLRQRC